MAPLLVCQLCNIPFDLFRIRKFIDPCEDAIAFNGPGHRRWMPGSRPSERDENYSANQRISKWDLQFEESLKALVQKREAEGERVEDLLEAEDKGYCGAKEGCRHIGIAPDDDPLGHMAGPFCQLVHGYNGYWITAAEMEERSSMMCLTARSSGLAPNTSSKDSWKRGNLCTLVESNPSWDNLSNMSRQDGAFAGQADLPMHPSCFEIYKKLSLQQFRKVDIDGLWELRSAYTIAASEDPNIRCWKTDEWMPSLGTTQPTDLDIVLQDEYVYQRGTEYLAADPVHVPGLDGLIAKASERRTSDIALPFPKSGSPTPDTFSILPVEIRRLITEVLPRKDLANLRIASQSFTEISQSYFHHLIKKEMPWVWEINNFSPDQVKQTNWLNLWLALSNADGGSCDDEKKRAWARTQYQPVLNRARAKLIRNERDARSDEKVKAAETKAKVDLQKVFNGLVRCGVWKDCKKNELKGLRNRRRIWGQVERMVGVIGELQKE